MKTQEIINKIKLLSLNHSRIEISKLLSIPRSTLGSLIRKHHIKTKPHRSSKRLATALESEIIDMYKSGLSSHKISKIVKIPPYRIQNVLKINKCERRSNSLSHRKHSFDESYFETVDTQEKAYWLGFMYADGNVFMRGKDKSSGTLRLGLHFQDLHIVEAFKTSLKSSNPITKSGNMRRIDITSAKMCNDLIKLGCVPKKSFLIRMPKLPHYLIRHFIRGYFDGDGCFKFNKKRQTDKSLNIVSNKNFIGDLISYLNESDIKMSLYPFKHTLAVYGDIRKTSEIKKFYNLIYKDAIIFLRRKKIKIEEWFLSQSTIFNQSSIKRPNKENPYVLEKL